MPTVPVGFGSHSQSNQSNHTARVIVLIKQKNIYHSRNLLLLFKKRRRETEQKEKRALYKMWLPSVSCTQNLFCYFIGSSVTIHVLSYLSYGRAKMCFFFFCAMSHALRIFVSSKNIRVAKCIENSSVFLAAAQQHQKDKMNKWPCESVWTARARTALKINDGNEHTLFHLECGHFSCVSPILIFN